MPPVPKRSVTTTNSKRNGARRSSIVIATQRRFIELLPRIRQYAERAFGRCKAEAREEAIAEVIANSYVAVAALAVRGKLRIASPAALAKYAVRQFYAGRRVGTPNRSNDLMSKTAQRLYRFRVRSLDTIDDAEILHDSRQPDHRTRSLFDRFALRSDLSTWLHLLPVRERRIAKALACGHSAVEAARRFRLSRSRISQLRRRWLVDWLNFQGES